VISCGNAVSQFGKFHHRQEKAYGNKAEVMNTAARRDDYHSKRSLLNVL
jgi:hypothetical protein